MTHWDFNDSSNMFSHLIGRSFGDNPETRLAEIRAEKKYWAGEITRALRIHAGSRVLEIGPGCGLVTREVAPLAGELHGCDISPSFLAKAQEECRGLTNVFFHEIVSAKLDFAVDESFDSAFALSVFIHFDIYQVYSYFRELGRVLKSGGALWFDVVSGDDFRKEIPDLFFEMADLYDKDPSGLPRFIQFCSEGTILGLARQCGFKFVSTSKVGPTVTTFLFRKN